jgi:hypothetical protein
MRGPLPVPSRAPAGAAPGIPTYALHWLPRLHDGSRARTARVRHATCAAIESNTCRWAGRCAAPVSIRRGDGTAPPPESQVHRRDGHHPGHRAPYSPPVRPQHHTQHAVDAQAAQPPPGKHPRPVPTPNAKTKPATTCRGAAARAPVGPHMCHTPRSARTCATRPGLPAHVPHAPVRPPHMCHTPRSARRTCAARPGPPAAHVPYLRSTEG